MGFVLGFMLLAATTGRLALSWPGALVAGYYAMQAGWKPVMAAALGLLGGNLAALLFIPVRADALLALHGEPALLLVRCAAALYLVALGLWLVHRGRRNRPLGNTPGIALLAFATALIAQLGNIDAQFIFVLIASGFMPTGADVSTQAATEAARVLLPIFVIVESVMLIGLPLVARLFAKRIRQSRVDAYLGLVIVAAGVLIAIPSGPLRSLPPRAAAPTSAL